MQLSFPFLPGRICPEILMNGLCHPGFPNPHSDFRPKRAIFRNHLFAMTEVYVGLNDVIFVLVRKATKQNVCFFFILAPTSYFDLKTLTNFRPSWWAKLGAHTLIKSIPVFRSTGVIHHALFGWHILPHLQGCFFPGWCVWTEKTCWGNMLVPS